MGQTFSSRAAARVRAARGPMTRLQALLAPATNRGGATRVSGGQGDEPAPLNVGSHQNETSGEMATPVVEVVEMDTSDISDRSGGSGKNSTGGSGKASTSTSTSGAGGSEKASGSGTGRNSASGSGKESTSGSGKASTSGSGARNSTTRSARNSTSGSGAGGSGTGKNATSGGGRNSTNGSGAGGSGAGKNSTSGSGKAPTSGSGAGGSGNGKKSTNGSGAGGSGSGPQFKVNEKVLCYEPDIKKAQVLYDSKVLEVVRKQDASKGVYYEYKIHFQGWKCTWDRYVREDNVLKTSVENRELQRQLREKVEEDKAILKKKKRKSIKEKLQAVQDAVLAFNVKQVGSNVKQKGATGRVERSNEITEGVADYDSSVINLELQKIVDQLIIPSDLKQVLEYDLNKIQGKKWLVKLPCEITAAEILEEYLRHIGRLELRSYVQKVRNLTSSRARKNGKGFKVKKAKHGFVARPNRPLDEVVNAELVKTMQRITYSKNVVENVRLMFDYLLPRILLYKNEADQLNEFLNGDFNPQPEPEVVQPIVQVVVEKPKLPKPVEDESDDLIIQNVIKKNMPPPPVPPLKRRTRSAGNDAKLDIPIPSKKDRHSCSAIPSSSHSKSSRSTVETELDPTKPLEMMPLSEIKTEPLDEVVEPATKRRKVVATCSGSNTISAMNTSVAGPSSALLKVKMTPKKDSPRPRLFANFASGNVKVSPAPVKKGNVKVSPALAKSGDKFGCELEDKCQFSWACRHLNKFMDQLNEFEVLPPSTLVGGVVPPSGCYGMQHLLRLFVRSPHVFNRSSIPPQKMESIIAEMNSILLYLVSIKGIVTKDDWHHPGITLYEEDYIDENNCHLFAEGTPSRSLLKKSKKKFREMKRKEGEKKKKSKKRCLVSDTKPKNASRIQEKRGRKKSKEVPVSPPGKRLRGRPRVAAQLQVTTKRNSQRLSGKMIDPIGGTIAMGVRKSLTQEELSRETLVAANITASTPSTSTPTSNVIVKTSGGTNESNKPKPKTYSLRQHSRPLYK